MTVLCPFDNPWCDGEKPWRHEPCAIEVNEGPCIPCATSFDCKRHPNQAKEAR